MLQKVKRQECKLISSATCPFQGEDTEVRQGDCWFVLTHSLPVQFLTHNNIVQPKVHLRGVVSPGQPAVRSLCEETELWRSAIVHLTFLSHDLASPSSSSPGAWMSCLPGNKELFSPLLLSSFCKAYMLHVLPSLQMFVTLQHNPFLFFPGETRYLYVK